MKILLILFLVASSIHWEPDFDNAKRIASSEHKLILLIFSGSDWCAPCILLRRDYLESAVFTKMANDNLVLVNADFPRKKKNQPTAQIVKQNDALAEKYNKAGNFPFLLLLDENGKILRTWTGKPAISSAAWTSEIKILCDANR